MTEKEKKFHAIYPNKYFADGDNLSGLDAYLNQIGFLQTGESVSSAAIPGEGNMNYVLRVKTNERTFILKQSRPWVEKYPTIEAPIERINIEAEYYKSLEGNTTLKNYSPSTLHFDPDNYVMIIEDLGDVDDYTFVYRDKAVLENESIKDLAEYLSALHELKVTAFPENLEMRKLNHEHIFNYPYKSDNGFNLDDVQAGLGDLAVTENF